LPEWRKLQALQDSLREGDAMKWADFTIEPYREDIRKREERIRVAGSFKEADRIPVTFSIGGSYHCGRLGVSISDYYDNPEMQVEVQLQGIRWEYEHLRADSCTRTSVGYETGPIAEAVVFGAEIERPNGTSPRIVHKFASIDEALAGLDFPPPAQNDRLKELVSKSKRFEEAARKAGVRVGVNSMTAVTIHPPLSTLCSLLDPSVVYEEMMEQPEKVKKALDICFAAYLAYPDPWVGEPPADGVWLADDNCCFISADAFREFEMPYYHRLVEKYRPREFFLHTDGPSNHLFPVMAEAGINSMDVGGFSDLSVAVACMKGKVYISGGLNCKDFYGEGPMSPETRRKALSAMRLAGPGGGFQLAIGGETYVHTSPQGICELVKLVEERGKYPLDIQAGETD